MIIRIGALCLTMLFSLEGFTSKISEPKLQEIMVDIVEVKIKDQVIKSLVGETWSFGNSDGEIVRTQPDSSANYTRQNVYVKVPRDQAKVGQKILLRVSEIPNIVQYNENPVMIKESGVSIFTEYLHPSVGPKIPDKSNASFEEGPKITKEIVIWLDQNAGNQLIQLPLEIKIKNFGEIESAFLTAGKVRIAITLEDTAMGIPLGQQLKSTCKSSQCRMYLEGTWGSSLPEKTKSPSPVFAVKKIIGPTKKIDVNVRFPK